MPYLTPACESRFLEPGVGPDVESAQGAEVQEQVLGDLLVGDSSLVYGQVQNAVLAMVYLAGLPLGRRV